MAAHRVLPARAADLARQRLGPGEQPARPDAGRESAAPDRAGGRGAPGCLGGPLRPWCAEISSMTPTLPGPRVRRLAAAPRRPRNAAPFAWLFSPGGAIARGLAHGGHGRGRLPVAVRHRADRPPGPRGQASAVDARVLSMKTGRSDLRRSCPSRWRCRCAAMSGRGCLAASAVFLTLPPAGGRSDGSTLGWAPHRAGPAPRCSVPASGPAAPSAMPHARPCASVAFERRSPPAGTAVQRRYRIVRLGIGRAVPALRPVIRRRRPIGGRPQEAPPRVGADAAIVVRGRVVEFGQAPRKARMRAGVPPADRCPQRRDAARLYCFRFRAGPFCSQTGREMNRNNRRSNT